MIDNRRSKSVVSRFVLKNIGIEAMPVQYQIIMNKDLMNAKPLKDADVLGRWTLTEVKITDPTRSNLEVTPAGNGFLSALKKEKTEYGYIKPYHFSWRNAGGPGRSSSGQGSFWSVIDDKLILDEINQDYIVPTWIDPSDSHYIAYKIFPVEMYDLSFISDKKNPRKMILECNSPKAGSDDVYKLLTYKLTFEKL